MPVLLLSVTFFSVRLLETFWRGKVVCTETLTLWLVHATRNSSVLQLCGGPYFAY